MGCYFYETQFPYAHGNISTSKMVSTNIGPFFYVSTAKILEEVLGRVTILFGCSSISSTVANQCPPFSRPIFLASSSLDQPPVSSIDGPPLLRLHTYSFSVANGPNDPSHEEPSSKVRIEDSNDLDLDPSSEAPSIGPTAPSDGSAHLDANLDNNFSKIWNYGEALESRRSLLN